MKRYLGSCVVVLCGALVSGGLSGCITTESSPSTPVVGTDARPAEVQPKPRVRTRSKQGTPLVPITIAKAAATPTASAKSKTKARVRSKEVLSGTSVPFYFSIESWPTGISSLSATARCFQVNSIANTSAAAGAGVTSTGYPIAVFSGGAATYLNVTLTPGATTQVNVTCPSTTAGKQLMLVITGSAESSTGDVFDFGGSNIFVVNP